MKRDTMLLPIEISMLRQWIEACPNGRHHLEVPARSVYRPTLDEIDRGHKGRKSVFDYSSVSNKK